MKMLSVATCLEARLLREQSSQYVSVDICQFFNAKNCLACETNFFDMSAYCCHNTCTSSHGQDMAASHVCGIKFGSSVKTSKLNSTPNKIICMCCAPALKSKSCLHNCIIIQSKYLAIANQSCETDKNTLMSLNLSYNLNNK